MSYAKYVKKKRKNYGYMNLQSIEIRKEIYKHMGPKY
jgi:hypothetical protein